ncbi:hypothetical protein HNV28_35390 [Myxococcus xanthus]|uniref:Uncharacterized protein n=2 Tax=Myxococcus xanthus TaxID=34 RepID=A0A7Y4MVC1_MYXXA|nr:hypothetical protein [Myxococcus xanthus]
MASESLAEQIEAIKARCEAAGIKHEAAQPHVPAGAPPPIEQLSSRVGIKLKIPTARDLTPLLVVTDWHAEMALSSQFEKYRLLRDVVGIWSQQQRVIECEIDILSVSGFIDKRLIRKIASALGSHQSNDHSAIDPKAEVEQVKLFIGDVSVCVDSASTELAFLNQETRKYIALNRGRSSESWRRLVNRVVSIRIENVNVSSHDEAMSILEKVSNSVFFGVDLALDLPIGLRRRIAKSPLGRDAGAERKIKIGSRISQYYDDEPMSLYWYGRSASHLPLLAFLAFYQVLEYYFPRYSLAAATKRAKQILRDPRFDSTSDTDIAKLLRRTQGLSAGRPSELAQLQAAISECLSPEDVLDFLSPHGERLGFYTDKDKAWKKVADAPVSPQSTDLLADVARRIYRIRCRIVHTKGEEQEVELLLPFSREAQSLTHDIALVEFVATKVLIASSSPSSGNGSEAAKGESSA